MAIVKKIKRKMSEASARGTYNREPDFQTETIGKNDVVAISAETARVVDYMGGELIAKLSLGGAKTDETEYPPQELHLLSVHWQEDGDYQNLVARAQAARRSTSKFVLLALNPEGHITGAAFVPETHPSTLGREGSLRWFDYSGAFDHPDDWTPFDDNRSVSRRQLALHATDQKVIFVGATENSSTKISALKIDKQAGTI